MVEWDGGGQHKRKYFPSVKIYLQLHAIFWMSFIKTEARLKKYFDCIYIVERIGAIKYV